MSEIPTLSKYDGRREKIRCSVQWVISQAYGENDIPTYLPQKDIEHMFESDGSLKKSITILLCYGDPYFRIVGKMFNLSQPILCHEEVIQILCSKGLYVLDSTDSLVTANDLRKIPLMLDAHRVMMDMLMFSSVSHLFNSLVTTVKKFSNISPSVELPKNLEEAVMLWLNEVSSKVETIHRDAVESDKHTFGQQRKDDTEFPTISNVTADLCDGRSLALLLHYYCPNHIPLKDISLKDPMSIADSWHNLQICFNFCNNVLFPPNSPALHFIYPSILHPIDFLYCDQYMKNNMMIFFGSLFYHLEMEPERDVVSPRGHSVLYRIDKDNSYEDITNEASLHEPHPRPLTFASRLNHQHAIEKIIPAVQPLISNVTRNSFQENFSKPAMPNNGDVNGNITWDGIANPFGSKPLLVRRNKDHHSSSKPKHLLDGHPTHNYPPDESVFHPLRKVNSHHHSPFQRKEHQRGPERILMDKDTVESAHFQSLPHMTPSHHAFGANDTTPVEMLSNMENCHISENGMDNSAPSYRNVGNSADFHNTFCPNVGQLKPRNVDDVTISSARSSDSQSPSSQTVVTDSQPLSSNNTGSSEASSISCYRVKTFTLKNRENHITYSSSAAGSGDSASTTTLGSDEVIAGGAIVKLRSPHRQIKKHRAKKTTSWLEVAKGHAEKEEKAKKHKSLAVTPAVQGFMDPDILLYEKRRREKDQKIHEEFIKLVRQLWREIDEEMQVQTPTANHGLPAFDVNHEMLAKTSKHATPAVFNSSEEKPIANPASVQINRSTVPSQSLEQNYFASPLSTTCHATSQCNKSQNNNSFVSNQGPAHTRNQTNCVNQKQTFVVNSSKDSQNVDLPNFQNSSNWQDFSSDLQLQGVGNIPKSDAMPSMAEKRTFGTDETTQPNMTDSKTLKSSQDQRTFPVNSEQFSNPISVPDNRQMTYEIVSQQDGSDSTSNSQDPKVLQSIPTDQPARRSLFANQAPEIRITPQQENIDPNLATDERINQASYDSFVHEIDGTGSNHSTPYKLSPKQEDMQGNVSPELKGDTDMSKKGGEGFVIIDNVTPNSEVAKKRDKFLMDRLRKDEERKKRLADIEKKADEQREEARRKNEEMAAKKQEENRKRQLILEKFKQKRLEQEEAQLIQQSSAIVTGGSTKKTLKPAATLPRKAGSECGATQLTNGLYTPSETKYPDGDSGVSTGIPKGFRARKNSGNGNKDWDTESSSSAVSSAYTGPRLYKQPTSKSNKPIIYNAICHCCLPGKVDEMMRNNTLHVLEMSEAQHFMVLFRDSKCQYRGLYTYNPETEVLHKISGIGPSTVTPNMIEQLFKYNSGRKAFTALTSKTLSVSIDAISIKNTLWTAGKRPHTSKK